jgi:hypothetical protein
MAPTTSAAKELEEKLARARQAVAEAEAKLVHTRAEAEARVAQAERVAEEAKSQLAEVEEECEAAGENWAVHHVFALSELWALVVERRGVVGAWRLMRVCRAARAGAREFLSTLPGLAVCGGHIMGGVRVGDALRLDLATMRWEPMPALVTARSEHACCAVRGTLVVLGGVLQEGGRGLTSSVEMLSSSEEGGGAFVDLPPLSYGGIRGAAAVAVEESDSAAGQVLLLGGRNANGALSTVQLVDLATGACAPQNNLLHPRVYLAAGRLPDGHIVCAGGFDAAYADLSSAELWGAPAQGAADAAWTWRELPAMCAERYGCSGCVMSDGRFAVLGGTDEDGEVALSSCEALVANGVAHWESLPPMHDARSFFACGAVAGCVIVAGGHGRKSAELYDAELNRWLRLPCDFALRKSARCDGQRGSVIRFLKHACSKNRRADACVYFNRHGTDVLDPKKCDVIVK